VLVARAEVGDGTVTEHDGGILPIRTGGLDRRVADNCRGHLRGGEVDRTEPIPVRRPTSTRRALSGERHCRTRLRSLRHAGFAKTDFRAPTAVIVVSHG
jgi:hypothetical protein